MNQRSLDTLIRILGGVGPTTPRQRPRWASAILSMALLLVACGSASDPIESPITEEQATEMAENALEAFNDRDYTAWSRDWSESMKAAIDEDAFLAFRDQYHGQLGNWTAITNLSGGPGADEGTYRWTYDLEFENGVYRMWFGSKEGSPLIEGVSFEEISS